MQPRPVVYLDFLHPGALETHQGGQEAVQSLVNLDALEHPGVHDLEGAAGVVDGFLRQGVADEIPDPAADFLGQGVLPVVAPSVDHVVFPVMLQEYGNIARIVLQVGIQGDDDIPGGGLESGIEGGRLATVPGEGEVLHRWMFRGSGT